MYLSHQNKKKKKQKKQELWDRNIGFFYEMNTVICRKSGNKGAAITEAILVMPVLIVILLVAYKIYKASLLASNAAVAARTEIMVHSAKMNANNWEPMDKRTHETHESIFINYGLVPYAKADEFEITPGFDSSKGSWLEKIGAILTGSDVITVHCKLRQEPWSSGFLQKQISELEFSDTAVCATDPWALTAARFFSLLTELFTSPLRIIDDADTGTLDDEINPKEGLD